MPTTKALEIAQLASKTIFNDITENITITGLSGGGGSPLTVGDGSSTSVNNVSEILITGIITDLGDGTIGITNNQLARGAYVVELDEDGAVNLPNHGTVRNLNGPVNLVSNDFAQLQWTTPTGLAGSDPNDTDELLNWIFVDSDGAWIETNKNGTGSSNTWVFNTDGTITFPDMTVQTTAFTGTTINSIDDISDVAITTPSAGQVLKYDGTNWINGTDTSGTTATFTVISSNTTASANTFLLVDTSSSSVTVNLPASPAAGDFVTFGDGGGDKLTNPTVVGRNGNTIEDASDDYNLNTLNHRVSFVYSGSTWRLING